MYSSPERKIKMIKVTVNGEAKEFESALSAFDAAREMGLAKTACAAEINGKTVDLRTALEDGNEVKILTFEDEQGQRAFNHTASHVLAQAVKRLFPNTKLAIGPAIDNGFYYDFDTEEPFTAETLPKLEAEMKKIVKESIRLEQFTLSPEEAIKHLEEQNEPYKVELCREHGDKGEPISFYKQGDFTDLCAGPHLMSTSSVKAFKLTSVTGAYWRGSEKNKMLTRIYGTAFPSKDALAEHLERLEEAKKRDHRKLGKELGLFALLDEGPGFPFFLPKGMVLRNTLLDYWREVHKKYGYVEISTPIILNQELWHRSGNWDHYKDNMYTTVIDDGDYAVKPMNCPGGMLLYKIEPKSYRDFPLRMAELGLVHRHELSGALHGLFRVRCFTQDDAHIFMTWDQVESEIQGVVRLFDEVYSTFALTYKIEISTMPEDHIGEKETWDMATDMLKKAVSEMGKEYVINEGDGAFYGPKIDFHLSDSLGRTWQCGTIQLDMQMPERFELEYTGADGEKHRPVMIHRACLGSIERFIGVITEHFAGAFPLWLSPEQVRILPVTDRAKEYGEKIAARLDSLGIRSSVDNRNEKIGYKIRQAQLEKIPYFFIVGDKEVEENTVSLRSRKEGDLGASPLDEVIDRIVTENAEKTR